MGGAMAQHYNDKSSSYLYEGHGVLSQSIPYYNNQIQNEAPP